MCYTTRCSAKEETNMDQKVKSTLLPEGYVPRYFSYILRNQFRQTIDDYRYFTSKPVGAAAKPVLFRQGLRDNLFETITYNSKGVSMTEPFDSLMTRSGTTALLVIRNGTLLCERYYNGYGPQSVSRYMSATKSFLSALVGIALDERLIGSVCDPVTLYVPELAGKGFERITLENLLKMDSGIPFDEGLMPWSLQMKQYYSPDVRKGILGLKPANDVGSFFHYNDWHPELLTLILERVTGAPVTDYFEKKLWIPMGAGSGARIVTDSARHGFEKMDSGLCGTAMDLARFGSLFLNGGAVDGKKVVPESWVKESTSIEGSAAEMGHFRYYERHPWGNWFHSGKAYYKYFWWGYRTGEESDDYFAMGVLGQILYISPRKKTIMVRLGKDWGIAGWWPTVLKQISDKLPE